MKLRIGTAAGPERKKLSVKGDKKELNFDPKDLLKQIASIYVHLSWNDKQGLLAQAIVSDKRSYYAAMFSDAIKVKKPLAASEQNVTDQGVSMGL